MKVRCFWCKEKLANKSHRRYVAFEKGKHVYGHFCDQICIECWEVNREIEKRNEEKFRIESIEHGKKYRCKYCGEARGEEEFDYALTTKDPANRSNSSRSYYCNYRCLEKAYWEM